jgi:hypothetical protein
LRTRICRYNASCGTQNTDHSGYHETITRFYVHIIDGFLRTADRCRPVDRLAEDLIERYGDRNLPLRHYTRERLFSVQARRQWIEPDVAGLSVG